MTGSIYSDFLADSANVVTILGPFAAIGLFLWQRWLSKRDKKE
jgi:hypothetical protein